MALVAGMTIADRFRLKRLIGVGGTGWVWEAKDLHTKEFVALKVLRDDVAEDLITQARFRREADTVATLDHPGIARFVDYGHFTDPVRMPGQTITYLATEFIRGEPLDAVIHKKGKLPLNRALDILEATSLALGHAHAAGVVHRDVKPGNILITLVSVLLVWFIVVPAIRFLLVDAVWTGSDRNACLAENVGRTVGACWPFVQAKLSQFIYGFYPEPERWRVNLTFFLAAVLLLPLLIPRLPAKGINAGLFFFALPVVAFFLLYGGGLGGFLQMIAEEEVEFGETAELGVGRSPAGEIGRASCRERGL